jgi:16S rRNA processing protein RimM
VRRDPDARWIPLAEVARPHGLRGELRLRLYNRDSDLLRTLDEVLLRFPDGEEQEVSVDGARRADDAILIKLFSVDDRNRAEELRGAVVCARRRDFPPLEPGEFYACDVEGARVVVEGPDGEQRDLGRVRALRSYPTTDVLVVDATDGGGPWEVPLVGDVVRSLDVEAGLVTLTTMVGVERA